MLKDLETNSRPDDEPVFGSSLRRPEPAQDQKDTQRLEFHGLTPFLITLEVFIPLEVGLSELRSFGLCRQLRLVFDLRPGFLRIRHIE